MSTRFCGSARNSSRIAPSRPVWTVCSCSTFPSKRPTSSGACSPRGGLIQSSFSVLRRPTTGCAGPRCLAAAFCTRSRASVSPARGTRWRPARRRWRSASGKSAPCPSRSGSAFRSLITFARSPGGPTPPWSGSLNASSMKRGGPDANRARPAKTSVLPLESSGMVVVMNERASEAQIDAVIARLIELGMDVHRSSGVTRTVLGVVGAHKIDPELIGILDGVHEVLRITEPYKRASRTFMPADTVVNVGDVRIVGDEVIVMAGPCSAETDEQVRAVAAAVKRAGAKILRGGAFKPRSSPYAFQGLGEEGLRMLRSAADAHNLKVISEVMDISQIELIAKYSDIFQVLARNMQNYTLLRELGHARKPVLLKRGISATIEEWLLSAEYILP